MTLTQKTCIGVAGCGRMGLPMARAMSEDGYSVRGFDIRPVSEFGDFQDHMIADPADFADGLEILFSVVRDQPQTEDVLFGAQNFVGQASNLKTIVICSTLSPKYVVALRDRIPAHIQLVDAPMSGAQIAAEEKRLSFMLGGEEPVLDHLHPLFSAMGAHFHRMGGYGTGMAGKVLNNLVLAGSMIGTRLVMDWAPQMGINTDDLLALMHTSSGQNWLASNFDDIEFAADGYQTDNSLGILKKDIESAIDGAPDGADTELAELLVRKVFALTPR